MNRERTDWMGVAFGILLACLVAFQQFKLPPVLPVLLADYHWDRTLAGGLMAIYALARRRPEVIAAAGRHWCLGLAGGTLQLGSYGIAIWAMTVAPIAIVAALRETSVLFGALIAIFFLKEPPRAGRVAATLMIMAGLALIRLY